MTKMKLLAAILLCFAIQSVALAQRDSFAVRYLGGSLETKTDKDDWHNKLTALSTKRRITRQVGC
jgi:hypothetical protein